MTPSPLPQGSWRSDVWTQLSRLLRLRVSQSRHQGLGQPGGYLEAGLVAGAVEDLPPSLSEAIAWRQQSRPTGPLSSGQLTTWQLAFLQASWGEGGGQGGQRAGRKLQPLRHRVEEVTSHGCVVLWSPEGSQEGQPALEGEEDTGRNTGRGCLWGWVSPACQPGPQACKVIELLSYLGTSWWSSG